MWLMRPWGLKSRVGNLCGDLSGMTRATTRASHVYGKRFAMSISYIHLWEAHCFITG